MISLVNQSALIINFEGREVKGLSKSRYDETFAGEDGTRVLFYNSGNTAIDVCKLDLVYCSITVAILSLMSVSRTLCIVL